MHTHKSRTRETAFLKRSEAVRIPLSGGISVAQFRQGTTSGCAVLLRASNDTLKRNQFKKKTAGSPLDFPHHLPMATTRSRVRKSRVPSEIEGEAMQVSPSLLVATTE